jgi:N-acetylmuramoyl-L-alanine amidase
MVKIYVDAGHGGNDPGAQGNGLQEKQVTLQIAKKVAEYLRGYSNATVKMSRTTDKTVSLAGRTNEANAWGADYFLSIHINASGGTGYEDYIYHTLSDNSNTAKLRNVIHAEVMKRNDLRDRGKKKKNLHVLRESKMPAMLTENGFIDKKVDADKMKSDVWISNVARGHVNGLAKALGLKKSSGGGGDRQKYLEILVNSLWTYHTADWDNKAVMVNKGEVFTVIKDKFKVGNGYMYQIKSGLYITASPTYVRVYTK